MVLTDWFISDVICFNRTTFESRCFHWTTARY